MKYLFWLLITIFSLPILLFASDPSPDELTDIIVDFSPKQIKEFKNLADNGDAKAQLIIGLIKRVTRNSARKSYQNGQEALAWIEKSAKQNYAPAQWFLFDICENRFQRNDEIGEAKICNEKDSFLEKAISVNYPAAIWYQGLFYEEGKNVPQDSKKAIELYKKSGDLGYSWAYYRIGRIYEEGIGLDKNQADANIWYLKAAEFGEATAQDTIAVRISEGIGTKSNNIEAVKWFKKSAEQGHVYGSCNLALHYARGWGIKKNPLLALKWSMISNSLDSLKCHPDDYVEFLKPRKAIIKRASSLALRWLRQHRNLTNNFDERPWLGDGEKPITYRF